MLEPGTLVEDRYSIECLLGRGGMGAVYRARHVELGTLHALKVLSISSQPMRKRLLREGRTQGTLRHPNVVAVTDLVDVSGSPGLVLELVEGLVLDELLNVQLSLDQVDVLARQILAGVGAAHRQGLVHRDLKPANVLLAIADGRPTAKVTDFGLAKALDDDDGMTRSGSPMGTPGYMAPEQIEDSKRVDARTDVFALGVVLYELCCGLRPYSGSLPQLFDLATREQFQDPRSLRPQLPDRMVDAIRQALRADPAHRPVDADALLELWSAGVADPICERWDLPEPVRPAADTADASGSHPTLAELVDGGFDEHLEDCAACRVELRVYTHAFEDVDEPQAKPRIGFGGAAAAAGLALPLTAGFFMILFGSIEGTVKALGPWWIPLVLLSVVTAGVTARRTAQFRAGEELSPTRWLVMPLLAVAVGLFGAAVGTAIARGAVGMAEPEFQATMMRMGLSVALRSEFAGWALAAVHLLAVTAATTPFLGGRPSRRLPALLALAGIGGSLLWAADAALREVGAAPFVIFVMLLLTSTCLAWGSDETENESIGFGRASTALAAIAAVTCTAMAVHAWHTASLFVPDRAPEGHLAPPTDSIATADALASALGTPSILVVGGWVVLAAVLAAVSGRLGELRRLRTPARTAALLLALTPAAAAAGFLAHQQGSAASAIGPAYLNEAVARHIAGLTLAPDRLRVTAGPAPLVNGDRITAVGDRPVSDLRDLVAAFEAVERPRLVLLVERQGQEGPRLIEVEVELQSP